MHAKMIHTSVGPLVCLLLAALGPAAGASMNAMKNQSPNQGPAAQLHQQQPSQPSSLAMQQQHGPAMSHAQHQQPPPQQQQPHQQQAQYVHEKEQELHINPADDDLGNINDPYQMLNEFAKPESRLPATPPHAYAPWNPFAIPVPTSAQQLQQQQMTNSPPPPPALPSFMYSAFDRFPALSSPLSSMHTPKFLPIFGYPQVFIPVPLYMSPAEMYYPTFGSAIDQTAQSAPDLEDMARAAHGGRRSSTQQRNSPIYYVRLPPTPYMYLPGLGASSPHTGYGSLMSLPSFPAISPVFNLPVNFLANGKPSGIYQMADLPNPMQFTGGFSSYPAARPNPYRPSMMGNYGHAGSFATSSYAQQPHQQPDTKMTNVKRPFFFNGRPEEIYVLPNNFNSMYPETGYY